MRRYLLKIMVFDSLLLLLKSKEMQRGVLKEIAIETQDKLPIKADLRINSEGKRPLIIICHGFLGYKRWGFFPFVSDSLAMAGFHVLTISFSMNGVEEETGLISYPDIFARNTVSREIEDLSRACNYAVKGKLPVKIEDGIGLMGHSRGAAVAIVVASMCSAVKSLVTWATPSRFDRYTDRRKEKWKRDGTLKFHDPRAETELRLDYSYYEDIDRNRNRFDIVNKAIALEIPHLMIHGTRDQAVTLKEAKRLITDDRRGPVKLVELDGCSHSFATVHPMKKASRCLKEATEYTVEFFKKTLGVKKEGE